MNNFCTICDSEIELDNGDVEGRFGITPIAFCVWCLSSTHDMIVQLYGYGDIDTLEQIIIEIKEDK